jgi:PHD/YefM family antitoxin component YafN of YafNO toxin-antitoxin module
MQSYSLSEMKHRHGMVLDQALMEPVQLTKKARPSHVVMSVAYYQTLLAKLEALEDERWGKAAMQIEQVHSPIGSDVFTQTLEQIIHHAET